VKRNDVLETIDWAEKAFGSLHTNSQCSRRDVMRCVNAGLVKSVGQTYCCDDDGSILEPERMKEGFILTEKGRAALNTIIWMPLSSPEKHRRTIHLETCTHGYVACPLCVPPPPKEEG
jgi:hypothetical protein